MSASHHRDDPGDAGGSYVSPAEGHKRVTTLFHGGTEAVPHLGDHVLQRAHLLRHKRMLTAMSSSGDSPRLPTVTAATTA